jgi:hypothetical protein
MACNLQAPNADSGRTGEGPGELFTEITVSGLGPQMPPQTSLPFALHSLFQLLRFYVCTPNQPHCNNDITSQAWPAKIGVHCSTTRRSRCKQSRRSFNCFLFIKHRDHTITSMTCGHSYSYISLALSIF